MRNPPNSVAPMAPTDAASVGVAMPARIEPRTATISTTGAISARASETLEEANGAQRNHADSIGRDAQRLLPRLLLNEAVGVTELEGAGLSGRHRMSTVVRSDRRNEVIRPAEWCINPDGVAPGRHGDDEIVVDARPQLNDSTRLQQGG